MPHKNSRRYTSAVMIAGCDAISLDLFPTSLHGLHFFQATSSIAAWTSAIMRGVFILTLVRACQSIIGSNSRLVKSSSAGAHVRITSGPRRPTGDRQSGRLGNSSELRCHARGFQGVPGFPSDGDLRAPSG